MIHLFWPLVLVFVMFYGFEWYAGQLSAAPRQNKYVQWANYPLLAVFGCCDILFNITFGTVMYLEFPFVHGITFSMRTQYWYDQGLSAGGRYSMALWWKNFLDKILPGHIS